MTGVQTCALPICRDGEAIDLARQREQPEAIGVVHDRHGQPLVGVRREAEVHALAQHDLVGRIVEAAVALADTGGAEAVTVRALGAALRCDPSALYRHFGDVDELHRAVGDHFLGGVDVEPRKREGWRAAVRRLCVELRGAQLRHPRLASFVQAAPTRLGNELAITEAL